MNDDILAWTADDGLVPDTDTHDPLLAADSWLVQDGRVRGIELHRQRFTDACADAAGLPEATVTPFWQAALARLPRTGDLFPRVELVGDGHLRVRVRPAPRRGTEIRVLVPDEPDPRLLPRRKGPDLARLGVLRSTAVDAGADDALLTTPSGVVLESGTASLLWWEGDTLCVPDPHLPVLGGVTARLIREHASDLGIAVAARRAVLADLDGRETWLVNALHGIRPVTAWVRGTVSPGPTPRAPEWRRWWQSIAAPLRARHLRPVPARSEQAV
jgi:branched-subunit amino acid aminotransferase/4-amino-4-deoxychorismate lyase